MSPYKAHHDTNLKISVPSREEMLRMLSLIKLGIAIVSQSKAQHDTNLKIFVLSREEMMRMRT